MGIPIPGGILIPGTACGDCFDVDLTPQFCYVTISGLNKTPPAYPWLPDNCNGLFRLEYLSACTWWGSFGPFIIEYRAAPGTSGVSITIFPTLQGQFGVNPSLCQTGFKLDQFVGLPVYSVGYASVTF